MNQPRRPRHLRLATVNGEPVVAGQPPKPEPDDWDWLDEQTYSAAKSYVPTYPADYRLDRATFWCRTEDLIELIDYMRTTNDSDFA